jgi:DegV family protein with EDD domain
MTVAVIVDGAAGLTDALAAEWNVRVLPLALAVDGRAVDPDDEDAARTGRATTSGPSPGAFAAAFDEAPDGAVVVTVASTLSVTNRAAILAAGAVDVPVRVVDSRSAAGGQALVALAAARVAQGGGSLDEVESAAREATRDVRLIGSLRSLEGLVRSGRVPGLAGAAGRMLNVNPLFELRDGSVHTLRPAFTREAALHRMVDILLRTRPATDGAAQVISLHAEAPDVAERLLENVRSHLPVDVAVVTEFGPALVAITGPGIVGVAWRWSAQPL